MLKRVLFGAAAVAACTVFVQSSFVQSSHAEWPMARHDRQRTGAADGTGNITDPAPYYRHYLGGSLSSSRMLNFDVDEDGTLDFLMLTGGRVVARTVADEDLWSSPPRGYSALVGIADVDGNGTDDLVVYSSSQVFVLDPRTGNELWAEPPGEMGTVGTVRLADFDNDGSVDVLIAECGCCGVNSGYPGAIYTFTDGFASARKLWELPEVYCGFGRAITVVEVDGAAPIELLSSGPDRLRLWRPATGELVGESPALGNRPYWNRCWPVQADADAGRELACFLFENNSAVVDRWRVTVLDASAPGTLSVLWSVVLAPDATGGVRVLDPVVDLDADGSTELVVAVANSGVWETRIYEAATGTLSETIADTIVVGHMPVAGGRQLVTRSTTALSGWSYAAGTASATWSLPGHDAFRGWSHSQARILADASELVTVDLDDDGDEDLLAIETTGASSRLVAYGIDGATATELASYELAAGTDAQAAWAISPVTDANANLAVSYSDGFLVIHDSMLRPAPIGGEFEQAILRTGGYYAAGAWRDLSRTPVVAALEAASPDAVVVGDARGALLRLDASVASWASGPRVAWEQLYTSTPSIIDGLIDGSRGISCFAVRNPGASPREHDARVLTPAGATHWSVPVDRSPLMDLVPGDFDGDTIPDLVFHWGGPSDTLLRTRAISGSDGSTLWDSTPIETGSGRQPAGISIGQFDGVGPDDVYFEGGATRVLSGDDGTELAALTGPSYFMPTLIDVDGDPGLEVVLHGGVVPIRVADDDLSGHLWISTDDDRPFPYGSVVDCPADRTVLLSGSWAEPSRLKQTELRGAGIGTSSELWLASGVRYATRAELDAAGVLAGQLSSVAIHRNLAGDSVPAALVGSSDGWLYWLNACDGSLVHAVDFGVAVGQPVFGDTDDDGLDEILVSAADGFLYGIKQRNAPSPEWVNDIDPADPTSTEDVDSITSSDTLVAKWADVAGAQRYEVGAFSDDGTPVATPAWQDAGVATELTLTGLPLTNGRRYYVAVRAVVAEGPSVDTLSDGVLVRFPMMLPDGAMPPGDGGVGPGPDGGAIPPGDDDGCGCRVAGAHDDGRGWWLAIGAVGLLSYRRRKR